MPCRNQFWKLELSEFAHHGRYGVNIIASNQDPITTLSSLQEDRKESLDGASTVQCLGLMYKGLVLGTLGRPESCERLPRRIVVHVDVLFYRLGILTGAYSFEQRLAREEHKTSGSQCGE